MSRSRGSISSARIIGAFFTKGGCSETLFHILDRAFENPALEEERASSPFSGGILQHGYQCGMIWGAALAAGAQSYRLFGAGPEAQTRAVLAARRVLETFRAQNQHTDCFEITEINTSSSTLSLINYFLVKGGTVGCVRRATRYAPAAFHAIDSALAEETVVVPQAPVSCAALVAQKLGASEKHTVMAAGLAGGIGLSGGACGALGAAIWMTNLSGLREGSVKNPYKAPGNLDLIERFLKCTDYEFECSRICGRTFEGVGDHARHLRQGGCSRILEALAVR